MRIGHYCRQLRLPRFGKDQTESEEPTVKSSELLKIAIAIGTVALGMITYSLIVALQVAPV